MAGNHLQVLQILAHQFRAAVADIAVRGSVEAVTANRVLFIIFIRNGIHVCFWRHGGMESRIEYNNLGHRLAEHLDAGPDALDVRFIM